MNQFARWAASRPAAAGWLVVGLALAAAASGTSNPINTFAGQLVDTDVTDGTGVAAPPPATITAPVAATATSSAVTVSGTGEFASLKVTVSQTRDLVNQAVKLTWAGGKATNDPAAFDVDYLQVMQCWGDGTAGPERTQCEFGGNAAFDTRGGTNSNGIVYRPNWN